jgi:hypothetical protein
VNGRTYDASVNEELKHELWYSAAEIQEQRKDDKNIFNTIRQLVEDSSMPNHEMMHAIGRLSEKADWDVRGLEAMVDGGATRTRHRLRAVLSVLMEQDRQAMEGTGDDTSIAIRYLAATRDSREAAIVRGLVDHASAHFVFNRCLFEPRLLSPTKSRTVMSRAA